MKEFLMVSWKKPFIRPRTLELHEDLQEIRVISFMFRLSDYHLLG